MELMEQAQHDMRTGYKGGYTGVVVSGLIWTTAGLVAVLDTRPHSVWTLLIGGMLIHPLGIVLNKVLGASGSHQPHNKLGRLAMEGTVWMLMCIPLALLLSLQKTEWFFQAMLMIIGGRYLTFATLFGNRVFWLLGGALGMAGFMLFSLHASADVSVFTGAAIEIGFGTCLLMFGRRKLL
jgi:hypothetical protein